MQTKTTPLIIFKRCRGTTSSEKHASVCLKVVQILLIPKHHIEFHLRRPKSSSCSKLLVRASGTRSSYLRPTYKYIEISTVQLTLFFLSPLAQKDEIMIISSKDNFEITKNSRVTWSCLPTNGLSNVNP